MKDYLQRLEEDFKDGKLLMECIVPTAYDWLVGNGLLPEYSSNAFMLTAGIYRTAWLMKHPRTLQDLLNDPVVDQDKRAEQEKVIRKNIAKKMVVYDYLRSAQEKNSARKDISVL